jgi:hypothetical protein
MTNPTDHNVDSDNTERETYESPSILYREPLEAVAAVCAPAGPAKANPGACPTGPISS